MALVRCLERHSPPAGRTNEYVCYVYPVGYPDTALICGIPNCTNPGVIWLTEEERNSYEEGERIFQGPNNFTKMKSDDSGIQEEIN